MRNFIICKRATREYYTVAEKYKNFNVDSVEIIN